METAPLPMPFLGAMALGEQPFPIFYPRVEFDLEVVWRTKQMQMVGHQKVIANPPGGCLGSPDFDEISLNFELGEPGRAVFGIHGDEEDIGLSEEDVGSACGRFAANGRVDTFALSHAESVHREGEFERKIW
jgi:hypothetical protein